MQSLTIQSFVIILIVAAVVNVFGAGTSIVASMRPTTKYQTFGNWQPELSSPCPVGSSREQTSGICIEICRGDGSSPTNSNSSDCGTRVGETYDSRTTGSPLADDQTLVEPDESLSEPVPLPACKIMVLNEAEFEILPASGDGQPAQLQTKFGKVPVQLSNYTLSGHNRSATVCYPLSPQLLQCPQRRLNRDRYVLTIPSRSLRNVDTNETIDVRDYHTLVSDETQDPSAATITTLLACNQSVNPDRKLRCNYIDLGPSDYRYLDANNLSLWLNTINRTVFRPSFRAASTPPATNSTATDTSSADASVVNEPRVSLCFPLANAFTWCPRYWFLQKPEFKLQADHRLLNLAHDSLLDPDEYFIHPGNGLPAICSPPPPKPTFDVYFIHACLYVVSAVCLLVAFIIHLIVPSLNYHAKPLLCHMFSMLVMFVSLATRKFMTINSPSTCYTLFVITYLATLSSFFWLNVLSFDLWSIFNNLQTTSGLACLSCCRVNKNRFYFYSAYAWGVPLLLCAITILLDTQPAWQDALSLYPGIPSMCWFNERKSALVLLYVPLFAVLAGNLTLFLWTVWNLRQASKGVEVVNKKLNKQLLFVCFKLFVVMGLCWIAEAIAWWANTDTVYWYAPDILNAAQGVIIFAIYICKPQTYKLLRKKFSSQPEGRWTNEFNTSKGHDNKTSSSGITMNSVIVDRDNSLRSTIRTAQSDNTAAKRSSEAQL